MKKFVINYRHSVSVMAEDLEQANKAFRDNMPLASAESFYDVETQESHEVIGGCEFSMLSVFEGDDYTVDEDGLYCLQESDHFPYPTEDREQWLPTPTN